MILKLLRGIVVDHKDIQKEIVEFIKQKNIVSEDKYETIVEELNVMSSTEDLKGVNNLESFYKLWKSNIHMKGSKNKINSWTAYALGLTVQEPDPEEEFLPERRLFARAGFPDIDTDFEDSKRDQVIDYVREKYGEEYVANVGTYGTLKMRSALTRVAKALDIAGAFNKGKDEYISENNSLVREILDQIPESMGSKLKGTNEEGEEIEIKSITDAYECFDKFRYYLDKYPGIVEHCKHVEGLVCNNSIHASGVVISDVPMEQIAPLRSSTKGLGTQYEQAELEEIGLIKFDFLGLKTLTIIDKAVQMVKENYDIDLDLTKIPLDDEDTIRIYQNDKVVGVFQCEQWGMRNAIKEIQVDHFNDVVAANALCRPGPSDNIPVYCARKQGSQKIDYFHPKIKPYVEEHLSSTYGLPLFQEQIMQICNSLADFSIAEGLEMIKGIGKKKEHIVKKFYKKFIKNLSKKDIEKKVADAYWNKFIVPFSNYGFNKSHSVAYSLISWNTAYLKAHYPEEFFIASLNVNNEYKNFDNVKTIQEEMEDFDIELGPKRLNSCGVKYKLIKRKSVKNNVMKSIVSPSLMCKGVGMGSAEEIEKNQPYKDLRDLAYKVSSKEVTQETIGALVDDGFFDEYLASYNKTHKGNKLTKEKLIDKYVNLKDDAKSVQSKGLISQDIFS